MRKRLSWCVLSTVIVVWTVAAATQKEAAPAAEPIVYTVKFPAPDTHVAEIEVTVRLVRPAVRTVGRHAQGEVLAA